MIAERVAQFGNVVRTRLAPTFGQVGVAYPPKRVTLIGLKAERMIEVWVSGPDGEWKHLKDYPILGMSATYDGFRDSINTIAGLGPIAGAWANIVLIFLGIGLLWKADWSILSNNSELKKEA